MLTFSVVVSSSQIVFAAEDKKTKSSPGSLIKTADNKIKTLQVSLTKMPSKSVVVSGTSVTYTFKITNTGSEGIICSSLLDDKLGQILPGPQILIPGAMKTFTKSATILVTTTNDATLTCANNAGQPTTASASATVTVVNPAVTIDKTVSKTKVIEGQQVTYSYKVTNTGDVPLTDCNIGDDILGPVGPGDFALGVLAMITPTAMTNIAAQVTNTATVTCDEPQSMTTVSASDSETVMIVTPSVTIVKSVDQNMVSPGTLVTYSYKVINTGDVNIEDCQVTDSVSGNVGAPFNLAAPLGMNTVTDQVQIFNDVTNTATVTCNEPQSMNPVMATSNQVTVTIKLESSVDIIKTASPNPVEAGEIVTYTYDVTNNGQTNLSMCNISDDILGPIGDVDFSLVVGQSETFFASSQIFVDTKNIAEVVCLDPNNQPVGDMAMVQVIVIVVGGDYIPIDSTALLLAGLQTSSAWIMSALVIAGIAFGTLYFNARRD